MRFLLILFMFAVVSCQESFTINYGNIATSVPETSWIKQIGFETLGANASAGENCVASHMDSAGNIYCAGFTSGNLGEANAGSDDAFIMKINSSGSVVWTKQFGSVTTPTATGTDLFYSISVDSTGNIYAVGATSSALAEANAGGYDIFTTKLNSAGDVQWIKQYGATTAPGATGHDYPFSLTLDASGNIYIGGQTLSPLFEANGGSGDIVLMKLDSSGDITWGKQFGAVTSPGAASSGSDSCSSVYYKSDSEIYCVGSTASALGEANGGSSDVLLFKFNSLGVVSWTTQLGATTIGANAAGSDSCGKIDLDSSGNIYCGGTTSGNLAEASGGSNDIFVAKFSSAGALTWIKQLGSVTLPGGESSANDTCPGFKLDSSGNIFCAGGTAGSLGETFAGGTNNPYVLKMTPTGDISWIKQIGAETLPSVVQTTNNVCRNLHVYNGQPICTGRTGSNLVETNTGSAGDIFFFKLKSDGSLDI